MRKMVCPNWLACTCACSCFHIHPGHIVVEGCHTAPCMAVRGNWDAGVGCNAHTCPRAKVGGCVDVK